ncbi:MAG TPA: hypothetical protein VLD65_13750 [Anaerolineales bacterium]|nr:hypothetical protein [Anaerolineales bacterium]
MRHIFFRILAGLLLLAAIAGIAIITYNAGVAHGQVISAQAPAVQSGGASYPAYWWPFPFFGFGFLALLAIFFLFSMASAALRFMLWGPRFGWHRWPHRYGYWGERGERGDIPPMVSELHRRMHAAEHEKPTGQPTQKFD